MKSGVSFEWMNAAARRPAKPVVPVIVVIR